jgi:hypothetical protein
MRVRARHIIDADRPIPPPPRWSPLSCACPSVVHALPSTPSTPPSTSSGRRRRRLRPVSRGAVVFTVPPSTPQARPRCRPLTGEAPPCPSPRALPCTGDVATAEHACRAVCTLTSGQAGPGRGPRAHCTDRDRVRPGWAASTPCKRAAPGLCNWATADSVQWQLIHFYIF